MNYTQDTVESLAAKVADRIPRTLLFNDDTRERIEKTRRDQMEETLSDLVLDMNRKCGSNRRKTVSAVGEELSDRGIDWTWMIEGDDRWLAARGKECSLHVSYDHGLEVALDYNEQKGSKRYFHCTAREGDLADLIEMMLSLDELSGKTVEQRRVIASRDQMLCEIEFPSVELEIAKYMESKGFRHVLRQSYGKIILEVQIVNEIWMKKAMELHTLEDDLAIIPYLIKRPDCMKRDGRGFQIFHKWDWNKK